MFTPFFFHWYVKVPVPVATTLKFCDPPSQTAAETGEVVIAVAGLIVQVIPALVAVDDVKQAGLKLEVISNVTASLFTNPVVEYVEDVAPPMLEPFNNHWYVGVAPIFAEDKTLKVTFVPVHTVVAVEL